MKTKKFSKKNVISLVAALLIPIAFLTSAVPTYSGRAGVTDVIVEEVNGGADDALTNIASEFIDDLTSSFAPTFFIYRRLTTNLDSSNVKWWQPRKSIYQDIDLERVNISGGGITPSLGYDKSMNEDNFIVANIFTFAQRFGVVLATAATMFFLCLCLVGRAEQIRDTPIQIMIKYVIVMFLIYFSWDIIYEILKVIGDVWANFVVKGWDGDNTLAYDHFTGVDTNLLAKAKKAKATYLNWVNLGITCCGWFLKIKLIKNLLRMYIELAERYFVMTIMMFLFPAIAPTIISNSTSNVTHSYIRMFLGQAFLLLINSIFMKIYVVCIMCGAFTDEILGYVCGLAYGKFVTKLDSYMAAMGLNVAQTGGAMADSFAGSFMAVTNALRAKDSLKRSARNTGEALSASAIKHDSPALLAVGNTLQKIGGNHNVPQTFSNQVSSNTPPKGFYQGQKGSISDMAGVEDFVKERGLSNQQAHNMSVMTKGFDYKNSDLVIEQLDGSVTPSTSSGELYKLTGKNRSDGSLTSVGLSNGDFAWLTSENTEDPFISPSILSDSTTTFDMVEHDLSDPYHQIYTQSNGGEDATVVDLYDISVHPEKASEAGATFYEKPIEDAHSRYGNSYDENFEYKNGYIAVPRKSSAPVTPEETPEG